MKEKGISISLFVWTLCYSTLAFAVGEPALIMGMGGIKTLQDNSQTLFYNPANTSIKKNIEVGLSYSNSYCIKELSTSHLYSSINSKLGTLNIGYERFGNQNYNKNRAVLGYANRWNKFSAGVNFNYLAITLIGSPLGQMVYSQIGAKTYINKNITTSFTLANIEQSNITIDDVEIEIPTEILLGIKWSDTKNVSIYLEAEKCTTRNFICKCAAEYYPTKIVAIRLGVTNTPLSPTMGVGITTKNFTLNLGMIYNTQLGTSTSISLSYTL